MTILCHLFPLIGRATEINGISVKNIVVRA